MNVLDWARPRVVEAAKRPMDGARSPSAAPVLDLPVRAEPSYASPSARSHVLLVTDRRDSGAVPTPVWFALDGDDRLCVWTEVKAFMPVHHIEAVPAT